MRRYIVRRVAALAATLLFVSLLVFVVVRVLPGDPALIILGLEANPDSVARVREELGLDRPVSLQYAQWIGRALRAIPVSRSWASWWWIRPTVSRSGSRVS